jgi:UDP-glucose 4-epimerase
VGDVVEANISALNCKPDVFNIGTGVETSVNDLIDAFSSILKKDILHEHVAPRPGEVFRNVLDYSKASSKIGWQPKMQLKAGILKTFEHFKEIFRS